MRRSRRRRRGFLLGATAAIGALAGAGYWMLRPDNSRPLETALAAPAEQSAPQRAEHAAPRTEPGRDSTGSSGGGFDGGRDARRPDAASGAVPGEARAAAGAELAPRSARLAEIDALWKRYQAGDALAARTELNAMLANPGTIEEQALLRQHLARIAEETIFSAARVANDPLVEVYKVEPGDVLLKIGQKFDVPPGILMRINGVRDARSLRAGQNLKVVRGPFHARIVTGAFRLDLYLQDLYVRSFAVALGAEGRTPLGVWRVKERLENPTYYPPAGAKDKRIVAADDPANPLGEHWIGLEGLEGEAVGQVGYGIHGTNEPESIGKPVSLGCVRMLNEDAAFIYAVMQPGRSTVTTLP